MTQARLSTDLPSPAQQSAPNAHPKVGEAASSEGALWLFGATAVTLVFSSLLMIGLLTQQSVENAGLNGFLFAVAVGLAGLGLIAFAYVMTLARRAGYLDTAGHPSSDGATKTHEPAKESARSKASAEDDGLSVAPAVTAGIGVAKRRDRAQEQVRRSRQATAIATASMSRPPARPGPAPRAAAVASAPPPAMRSPAARPPQARPAPPRLRLPAPPVRPRTNAAMFQATVAGVRAGSFPTPMRPLPPSAYSRP